MIRTQQEIEALKQELLAKHWTAQEIDDMLCPGCGALGEACDENCPEFVKWLNDPEAQKEVMADLCQSAEREAGWDPNP
jgi:hypothetical protein